MMAALLLMFILIMSAVLYQSLNTYEQKNRELEEQRKKISMQENALTETKKQLNKLSGMVGLNRILYQPSVRNLEIPI